MRRIEQQVHRADAERFVGTCEEEVDPRAIDLAVEHQLQRPVFRLPPGCDDVEGAVPEPLATDPESLSLGE